jgi:2,5-dioxopentanoate dehydrogenase
MSSVVNASMQAAQEGFWAYRRKSGKERAAFLREIATQIEALGQELIAVAMTETNLPEARLLGERGRTCFQLRTFAELLTEGSWVDAIIDTADPARTPLPKPDLRKMNVAIGPVVVFGASNFPFAYSTAGVDTASALAAGCSVVVKGHPAHPRTSTMVAQAIDKATDICQMPKGVFAHLLGDGFELGQALVMHPYTKAVGFTGSFSGGKALFDLANSRPEPIPVFAEMGSTNPVFLLPDAMSQRAEQIAQMYAGSVTLGMGQFCTKPGLIIGLKGSDLETFSSKLSAEIAKVSPAGMLHAGIAKNFRAKRQEILSQEGVQLSGEFDGQVTDIQGTPSVAEVSADTFLKNTKLHQEVFGPFALVIACQDSAQMLEVAQHLEGQLTTTLMANPNDLSDNQELLAAVSLLCGRLILNGVPTGVEVCGAMQHGGPFPASTDSRFGSVGPSAVKRFVRPLSFQSFEDTFLPDELKNANPLGIWRLVDGEFKK